MINLTQKTELIALQRAIKICGTQKTLAVFCGVKQQQISKWLRNGVPIKRVLSIEKATKGQVKRYELRPDFYPE
jgi:DNA-binding transcriptional regulator YdaS (Cro superfamily)